MNEYSQQWDEYMRWINLILFMLFNLPGFPVKVKKKKKRMKKVKLSITKYFKFCQNYYLFSLSIDNIDMYKIEI